MRSLIWIGAGLLLVYFIISERSGFSRPVWLDVIWWLLLILLLVDSFILIFKQDSFLKAAPYAAFHWAFRMEDIT